MTIPFDSEKWLEKLKYLIRKNRPDRKQPNSRCLHFGLE